MNEERQADRQRVDSSDDGQTGGQMVDGQTDRQVNRLMDGEASWQTGRCTGSSVGLV